MTPSEDDLNAYAASLQHAAHHLSLMRRFECEAAFMSALGQWEATGAFVVSMVLSDNQALGFLWLVGAAFMASAAVMNTRAWLGMRR